MSWAIARIVQVVVAYVLGELSVPAAEMLPAFRGDLDRWCIGRAERHICEACHSARMKYTKGLVFCNKLHPLRAYLCVPA
jgi:hypothetical protein